MPTSHFMDWKVSQDGHWEMDNCTKSPRDSPYSAEKWLRKLPKERRRKRIKGNKKQHLLKYSNDLWCNTAIGQQLVQTAEMFFNFPNFETTMHKAHPSNSQEQEHSYHISASKKYFKRWIETQNLQKCFYVNPWIPKQCTAFNFSLCTAAAALLGS